MGKRAELELDAIRLFAGGMEIPAISAAIGVSENSLRDWKKRAGNEWDEARTAARKINIANMEGVGARLGRTREITARLSGDSKNQSSMGLILNQTMQSAIYDLLGQLQTAGIEDFETMTSAINQINTLTLSLGRLEAAASVSVKRDAEIRKQALDDVAARVDHVADAGKVMTADDFKRIIRESYGV